MVRRRRVLKKTLGSDEDVDFRRAPRGDWTPTSQEQGWVGSRLRLRLPEAGLFAKMLASRPASASKHSKVVGFGLGFGFLKCCF